MARFKTRPAQFRHIYPVTTICMHGSPLSRHDNRDLWKTYDYRDFGIIGEPYFDVDFNEVFYITDTGRRWNNAGAGMTAGGMGAYAGVIAGLDPAIQPPPRHCRA